MTLGLGPKPGPILRPQLGQAKSILNCHAGPPTGNLCPGGSSGVVPNPNDATCATFIQCNNGVPIVMNCNPGLLFNPSCGCCDWPANVDCGGGGGAVTTTTATTAQPTNGPATTPTPPTAPPASRCSSGNTFTGSAISSETWGCFTEILWKSGRMGIAPCKQWRNTQILVNKRYPQS